MPSGLLRSRFTPAWPATLDDARSAFLGCGDRVARSLGPGALRGALRSVAVRCDLPDLGSDDPASIHHWSGGFRALVQGGAGLLVAVGEERVEVEAGADQAVAGPVVEGRAGEVEDAG